MNNEKSKFKAGDFIHYSRDITLHDRAEDWGIIISVYDDLQRAGRDGCLVHWIKIDNQRRCATWWLAQYCEILARAE